MVFHAKLFGVRSVTCFSHGVSTASLSSNSSLLIARGISKTALKTKITKNPLSYQPVILPQQMGPVIPKMKKFKPITPSLRHTALVDRSHLWKGRPIKALTFGMRKTGGRNCHGRITVRHKGGGAKRRYRLIDFKRSILDTPGTIQRFEYDPNRTADIALLSFPDGRMCYIIAPQKVKVGDQIVATKTQELEPLPGNAMPLKFIPIGVRIHNMELHPGRGGQIARSAGASCQILDKESKKGYVLVEMLSKEQRYILANCMATIGEVSNPLHNEENWGKAGRSRWHGIRPTVRGVAMNPIDHPHGGGNGKKAPARPSCSPWGKQCKGMKTRRPNALGRKLIYAYRDGVKGEAQKQEMRREEMLRKKQIAKQKQQLFK